MLLLRKLFDLYVKGSIHVALAVFALVKITGLQFQIAVIENCAFFAFFGAIAGYNFVKYYHSFRTQKWQMGKELKGIFFLSVLSLMASSFYFLTLGKTAQIVALVTLVLTMLYILPFFPNTKNARNWAGMKIYIVAFCWVGVTVVLPVINAEIPITSDFYLKCVQRFILVFVLTLIFEIIDLKNDDPLLQTVPQQIGVKRTKLLGYILLIIFCGLGFFIGNVNFQYFSLLLIIAVVIALFLFFANENRSRYYAAFWGESIPILWWILIFLVKEFNF